VLDLEPGKSTRSMPERIHLSWYERAPKLQPGQRWQLLVRLKPPRGLLNPGGFDFERWLYLRSIGASGYVRESALNHELAAAPGACPVGALRGFLAARIDEALGARPGAAHVLGVAVGATHHLSETDWELLRRTGTTHLLAISGLNIAMVAAPFLLAGPLLGRAWPRFAGRPHAGLIPALIAAAVYTALAGFAVSTVRALVMLAVASALALRRRKIAGRDLLGAAALAVLVIDPPAIVSASFWLSFLAVAWLYLASVRAQGVGRHREPGARRPDSWWRRVGAAGLDLTRVQLVLGLGLAPVTLAWFRQVSLIAPLSNLIAVPVFSIAVMPLALLGTALLVPVPAAGAFLLRLAADIVDWLLVLLGICARMPFSVWEPPFTANAALAAAIAGAVVLCWWRPVPLRPLALGLLVPAVAGVASPTASLRVTVMDVGQGLAVLVQTARHAMLYDAGPAYRLRDAGESVIVPVLHQAGIARLDVLMISHDDRDHLGGAASVLKAHPQARLIAGDRSGLAADAYQRCEAGLSWEWDGVRFSVLGPQDGARRRSDNDSSCVLRIEAPRTSVLLPGDIERRGEEELARRGLLSRADLVLAPHHGSRSSSGATLVNATRPRFVVFSAGYLNRWGFPAPQVVHRWQEAGACVLDTASQGALVFAAGADGALQLVRRERADGAHLWTTAAGSALPGSCTGLSHRPVG
jgi:competence protein ComEC